MSKLKDLTGLRFGKLTVIERADNTLRKSGKTDTLWWCKCSCGNEEPVLRSRGTLQRSANPSCGCGRKDRKTRHGMTDSHLYRVWTDMKTRCTNPKSNRYDCYGGRGITICDDWINSFDCFMEWAISNGYQEGLSLERCDVNSGYNPDNCCWIERTDQAKNKQNTLYVEFNGEKRRLKECAEILNMNYSTLRNRWYQGERGDELFRPFGEKRRDVT